MTDLALSLTTVAVIGGLVSLDRRAAFQFMLSQPLVAVSLVGLTLGHLNDGVMLGAILQLLWMSSVLFGANIPRNETLASVTIGGAVFLYSNYLSPATPTIWTLAILLGAPVCILGQWLDIKLDHLNLGIATKADEAASDGNTKAISFCVFLSLTRTFLANAAATSMTTATVFFVLVQSDTFVGSHLAESLAVIGLYVVPSLGIAVAVSMLRHRRGVALACVTFAVVMTVLIQGVQS